MVNINKSSSDSTFKKQRAINIIVPLVRGSFRSKSTSLNVRRDINLIGQFCDVHFKSLLDFVEDLGIALIRDECDGEAFGAETSCSSISVEVGIRIVRHIIVEDNVDSFYVHASSK